MAAPDIGSLRWLLGEAEVSWRASALGPAARATPPDEDELEQLIQHSLADRCSERASLPRRIEVVHNGGQPEPKESWAAASRAFWAAPLMMLVEGMQSMAPPLGACCAEVMEVAPSKTVLHHPVRPDAHKVSPSQAMAHGPVVIASSLQLNEAMREPVSPVPTETSKLPLPSEREHGSASHDDPNRHELAGAKERPASREPHGSSSSAQAVHVRESPGAASSATAFTQSSASRVGGSSASRVGSNLGNPGSSAGTALGALLPRRAESPAPPSQSAPPRETSERGRSDDGRRAQSVIDGGLSKARSEVPKKSGGRSVVSNINAGASPAAGLLANLVKQPKR